MTRTLSLIVDDEAKTLSISGWSLFTLTELAGLGEQLKIKARLGIIRGWHDAEAGGQSDTEAPATPDAADIDAAQGKG